jgi:phosphate transport system substrate-binding protein
MRRVQKACSARAAHGLLFLVAAFVSTLTLGQQSPPPSAGAAADAIRLAVEKVPKSTDPYGAELGAMVESFPVYRGDGRIITEDIVIYGTESTAVLLMEVGRAWTKMNPESIVTVHQTVTSSDLAALERPDTSFASVARPLTAGELSRLQARGSTVHQVPIARDGVAIYVHVDNPIAGLTRRQCNGIVSATHSMHPELVLDWRDLDPNSPLGDQQFPLYMLDARSSTTIRITEWCMPGEPITTIGTFIEHSASSVVNACCAYRTAMGIASTSARQPRARMVPLAVEDGGPFVPPTSLTIADGSYPLTRSLNLVFRTPKGGEVPIHFREFLRFLWSEDGQDVVARLKIVPPDSARIPPQLGSPIDGIWK